MLPPNMIGLTKEQVQELQLEDEYGDISVPSGGFVEAVDPVGRRNGRGKATLGNLTTLHNSQSLLWMLLITSLLKSSLPKCRVSHHLPYTAFHHQEGKWSKRNAV